MAQASRGANGTYQGLNRLIRGLTGEAPASFSGLSKADDALAAA